MTADDIFNTVLGLMFCAREEKADYEASFYPMLNMVLAETFDTNNAHRLGAGKAELDEVPVIENAEDEIDYEEIILKKVVPYGIAGMLYAEDDDTGLGNYYREKYELLKGETGFARFVSAVEEV